MYFAAMQVKSRFCGPGGFAAFLRRGPVHSQGHLLLFRREKGRVDNAQGDQIADASD